MKIALVEGGPLIVGLEVYDDFMHYKGGVYHHTGLTDSYNPFEVSTAQDCCSFPSLATNQL